MWPSVQMGFITLHSTTAPLGPNAVETITFQLQESQVVDKPDFQDTFWEDSRESPESLHHKCSGSAARMGRNDRTGPGAMQLLQSLASHWSVI